MAKVEVTTKYLPIARYSLVRTLAETKIECDSKNHGGYGDKYHYKVRKLRGQDKGIVTAALRASYKAPVK